MDQDRAANVVDAEERVTQSSGNSDYGEVGEKRREKAEQRRGDDKTLGPVPYAPDQTPPNPD